MRMIWVKMEESERREAILGGQWSPVLGQAAASCPDSPTQKSPNKAGGIPSPKFAHNASCSLEASEKANYHSALQKSFLLQPPNQYSPVQPLYQRL